MELNRSTIDATIDANGNTCAQFPNSFFGETFLEQSVPVNLSNPA